MRLTVVEYEAGVTLSEVIPNLAERETVLRGIQKANRRIAASLHLNREALSVTDGKLRALGVAGVVQLTPSVELEVIPKFLHGETEADWKETLYLLSVIAKHGNILLSERIAASASRRGSLYEIAGRILAQEYLKCRHQPLRQYRKERFWDDAIEGDIELSEVFVRHPEGVEQTQIRFDRTNAYNATIREAMKIVRVHITDPQVKNILAMAIAEFGPQGISARKKLPIPARNREWQPAYELSFDIVRGMGSSYNSGKFVVPGFVVDTWRLWEWLLTTGVRIAATENTVRAQACVCWGQKTTAAGSSAVHVFPDIEVAAKADSAVPLYLVDAKYKQLKKTQTEIDRADLYEAFAFCSAVGTNEIVLAYPAEVQNDLPGWVQEYAVYHIKDVRIHVAQVSFGAIREKGHLYAFAGNLVSGLERLVSVRTEEA